MSPSKHSHRSTDDLPPAPVVWVGGEDAYVCARALAKLIPAEIHDQYCCKHLGVSCVDIGCKCKVKTDAEKTSKSITIIVDESYGELENIGIFHRDQSRTSAMEQSRSLVSVSSRSAGTTSNARWGLNHLFIDTDSPGLSKSDAFAIVNFLARTLTLPERVYLLQDDDFANIEDLFPDYLLSTVADAYRHPRSAKIKFVGVILTKPEVIEGKRLTWTAADRTGIAHFYYQFRGELSQFTWDWVQALDPGEIKVLPRMPMLKFRERAAIRLAKLPVRGVAEVIGGAGVVVKFVGKGLHHLGKKMHMGKSEKWVSEADVCDWLDTREAKAYICAVNDDVKREREELKREYRSKSAQQGYSRFCKAPEVSQYVRSRSPDDDASSTTLPPYEEEKNTAVRAWPSTAPAVTARLSTASTTAGSEFLYDIKTEHAAW